MKSFKGIYFGKLAALMLTSFFINSSFRPSISIKTNQNHRTIFTRWFC